MPGLSIDSLQRAFAAECYVADRDLATALYLSLTLDRPLLLEGEAGVGKTEVGRTLAAVLKTELIRLQCYEGLDVNTAVYEWDYPRQMLEIRLLEGRGEAGGDARHLQRPVPHPPPPAQGARELSASAARPVDRRDRQGGRGVRGLPARGARRLRHHDSGDRNDQGGAPAARHHHEQPHARGARRPEAPLPVSLDRLSYRRS